MVIIKFEEEKGYMAKVWKHNFLDISINKPQNYTTLDGNTYEYTANDASVADLDGDGEYEIAQPRPHAGAGRATGGVRMKCGEGEDE